MIDWAPGELHKNECKLYKWVWPHMKRTLSVYKFLHKYTHTHTNLGPIHQFLWKGGASPLQPQVVPSITIYLSSSLYWSQNPHWYSAQFCDYILCDHIHSALIRVFQVFFFLNWATLSFHLFFLFNGPHFYMNQTNK